MSFRKNWFSTTVVHVLCVTFVCVTLHGTRIPAAAARSGAPTSAEAAGRDAGTDGNGAFTLRGWQPTAAFMNRWALSDTSDVDFPDEPESEKHLVRDITIFVAVAAFVGFFIAEVFLKKDEDETPPEDDGKPIPSATLAR